jgi:2-methylcitrate dehydratase
MDATTQRLADYALATDYSLLSATTVHECKRRLIDTLASAMSGYSDPVCAMSRNVARKRPGDPSASVWGSGIRALPEAAAFANGVMLRFMDISDTYVGRSRGHPSDVMAGILAVADAMKSDGRSVINALTLAYDVYCSFIDAVEINRRGWDQPVYGVIASAMGVGRLLGFNRETMLNAISLALTPNMALAQSRSGALSNWKGCAGANAARNGVFAAMLAEDGFTGPTAVFEGVGGLWDVLGKFDWPLPDPAGPHMIELTHIKTLPICFHGQAAVSAALELRSSVPSGEIAEVNVDTYDTAVLMMANDATRWAPDTHETADHSMPYCVAVALLDGEVTPESFADSRLADPQVVSLMGKIKVQAADDINALYPEAAPSRVRVRLTSGAEHALEVRYAKGHARNPLTDDELEAKFRGIFAGQNRVAQGEAVLNAAWALEKSGNVGADLFALLNRE